MTGSDAERPDDERWPWAWASPDEPAPGGVAADDGDVEWIAAGGGVVGARPAVPVEGRISGERISVEPSCDEPVTSSQGSPELWAPWPEEIVRRVGGAPMRRVGPHDEPVFPQGERPVVAPRAEPGAGDWQLIAPAQATQVAEVAQAVQATQDASTRTVTHGGRGRVPGARRGGGGGGRQGVVRRGRAASGVAPAVCAPDDMPRDEASTPVADMDVRETRGRRAGAAEAETPAPSGGPLAVGLVIATCAATLLIAWFGRAIAGSADRYLGIVDGVVAPADALRIGARALLRPALGVVGAVLLVRHLHPGVLTRLRPYRRFAERVAWLLRWSVLVAPVAAWSVTHNGPERWARWWPLLLPASLAVGVLGTAYGVVLPRRLRGHRRPGSGRRWTVSGVLAAVATGLCAVWTLGVYAGDLGRADGHALEAAAELRPAVVVFATRDLRIEPGDGVTVHDSGADAASGAFRYRYAGLRLLRREGGRLYFVPTQEVPLRGRLIVLRDGSDVRIEYPRAASGTS